MLGWLKDRRRKALIAEEFPHSWHEHLGAHVPQYRLLNPGEQAKLRDDLRIFLSEKDWESAGGLELTDEMKIAISAQACLLILGIRNDYYPNVRSIIVYPEGYRAPSKRYAPGG